MKMKKIIISTFILLGNFVFGQSLSEIIHNKNTILVDVRTKEEFKEGSAPNAIHIPLSSIETRWKELKGNKNIVIFCKSGRRAEKAKEFLKSKGINAINGKSVENIKAELTK